MPPAPIADQDPITVNGASIPVGSLSTSGPSFNNSYNAIVSIDYNLSDSDQIRGRYIYNKITEIDTNANCRRSISRSRSRNNMALALGIPQLLSHHAERVSRLLQPELQYASGRGLTSFPGWMCFRTSPSTI